MKTKYPFPFLMLVAILPVSVLFIACSEDNEKMFTENVGEVPFNMIFVKGGTFTMGATAEQESDAADWEHPAHKVTISKGYYVGETEVTQGLWKAVMGENPSFFRNGDNYPVEQVSWDDVQVFIQELNRLTGKKYRLPTEAEWEYAARGGGKSQGFKYSEGFGIEQVAWYKSNSGMETHPVGLKLPNELGLYDMSGNVWEYCQDLQGSYSGSAQTDPIGASTGQARVCRGGGFGNVAQCSRVSFRHISYTDSRLMACGFRLAL